MDNFVLVDQLTYCTYCKTDSLCFYLSNDFGLDELYYRYGNVKRCLNNYFNGSEHCDDVVYCDAYIINRPQSIQVFHQVLMSRYRVEHPPEEDIDSIDLRARMLNDRLPVYVKNKIKSKQSKLDFDHQMILPL